VTVRMMGTSIDLLASLKRQVAEAYEVGKPFGQVRLQPLELVGLEEGARQLHGLRSSNPLRIMCARLGANRGRTMSRIEKSVFISYRRSTGSAWALAIAQNLTHHGYDVFFDYQGIASGDFEQVILENIKARAHFLVVLTPSALERVDRPGDWLRREIEAALEYRRNIVPLMLEGFDFATPSIGGHLTGTLAPLKNYNGLTVPVEYFDEAMNRLRARHLNVTVEAVLHPPSTAAREAATAQRAAAATAANVPTEGLTAERWFERGFEASDLEMKISYYTEAIGQNPDYARAYVSRGLARSERGDLDGALAEYSAAIRLKPDYANAYNKRGNVRIKKGDLDGALADYTEAIRLKPGYAAAYNNRGNVRQARGDVGGALADFTEAIRLAPYDADPYYSRGIIRRDKGELEGALADYKKYLDLGGGVRDDGQAQVESWICGLQEKLKTVRRKRAR
jgi:tetratricopeptide (TPR) repeat protein